MKHGAQAELSLLIDEVRWSKAGSPIVDNGCTETLSSISQVINKTVFLASESLSTQKRDTKTTDVFEELTLRTVR